MLLPLAIILSYIGSLPFGMINLNVLYTELMNGRKSAIHMAIGAALVEFIQGVVAAIIYARLVHFTSYEYIFRWAAIAVFIGLSIYYFTKPKKQIDIDQHKPSSDGQPFIRGIFLSSLNFMAIPFWLIILALINDSIDVSWHPIQLVTFGLGAGIGGFCASWSYMIIGRKILGKSSVVYKYLDYGLAFLFLVLAAVSFFI